MRYYPCIISGAKHLATKMPNIHTQQSLGKVNLVSLIASASPGRVERDKPQICSLSDTGDAETQTRKNVVTSVRTYHMRLGERLPIPLWCLPMG